MLSSSVHMLHNSGRFNCWLELYFCESYNNKSSKCVCVFECNPFDRDLFGEGKARWWRAGRTGETELVGTGEGGLRSECREIQRVLWVGKSVFHMIAQHSNGLLGLLLDGRELVAS